MSTRKRKNYLKYDIEEAEKPIYFESKDYKQCPIVIVEEKPIENYINEIEVLGYSFIEHPCQKFINKIYDCSLLSCNSN